MGCGLPMLFNITDITNSRAETHFKATKWDIGELLKFSTANWLAFPSNTILSQQKKKQTLNCRVWVNKINNNILLLNKRKNPPPKKTTKNNSGKSQARESFLNGGRWKYCSSAVDTVSFPSDIGIQNLKFIIRGIFPLLFSSILSEPFFPPVICLLFTLAWIQQNKIEYTSIVCSLTWDFEESFLFSFSSRHWASITRW